MRRTFYEQYKQALCFCISTRPFRRDIFKNRKIQYTMKLLKWEIILEIGEYNYEPYHQRCGSYEIPSRNKEFMYSESLSFMTSVLIQLSYCIKL